MGAVVFGAILIFVSFTLGKFHAETGDRINLRPWAWTARIFGMLIVIVGLFASTIVMVPAGYRGVLLQFTAVKGVLPEGIHVIVPYVNRVEMIEVRTQKETADNASAASKDLQVVTTSLALNYHIDPSKAGDLYRRVQLKKTLRQNEKTIEKLEREIQDTRGHDVDPPSFLK